MHFLHINEVTPSYESWTQRRQEAYVIYERQPASKMAGPGTLVNYWRNFLAFAILVIALISANIVPSLDIDQTR